VGQESQGVRVANGRRLTVSLDLIQRFSSNPKIRRFFGREVPRASAQPRDCLRRTLMASQPVQSGG